MISHGFQPLDNEDKDRHGGRGGALCAIGLMWIFFYLLLFITLFPDWSHTTWQGEENLVGRVKRFNGVFLRCISPKQGSFKCDNYGKASINLGADIQVQRAFMIVAVLLALFGVIIGMATLRCTTAIENDSKFKSIFGIVAGSCFFISGVTCGAAVSWFAWRVTYEFYHPLYQEREFKYEYGACLYIGWVAMLLGACAMAATIWFGVQVHKRFYDPEYKNNSFKYEYGSCLYIGWITAALSLISGLVLIVGSCMNMKKRRNDSYYPATTYQPTSATTKMVDGKSEYV